MKHQTVEQLETSADVHLENPVAARLSLRERLERWATALEREPHRRLNTLFETEHSDRTSRDAMRCDGSPLSVAFADPVLRTEGLESDTYGTVQSFFRLTDAEMHRITCYCLNGTKISAEAAARLLRTTRSYRGPGMMARALSWIGGRLARST